MRDLLVNKIGLPLMAIFVVGVTFGVGYLIGFESRPASQTIASVVNKDLGAPEDVDFSLFWETWKEIDEKFVSASAEKEVSDQERVYGAIQGLTQSLSDPYTVFLPPKEREIFEESISGQFGGVGMEIGMRDGLLTVIAPLKDTPAYRAGIQPEDRIIEIDGEFSQGYTINEAVELIRGEVGTVVELTLLRQGVEDPIEVEVVRENITIPTIETIDRSDDVFVIQLFNFSAVSTNLFRDALRDFVKTGKNKLIIDLRGNAGGFLEAAVDISSWFLPSGKVIVMEDFGEKEEQRAHRSKGYNIFDDDLEVVILTNGGSASASEIVAGALSEHGVATLIGTQTFGKGSVQELVRLSPDTSLKLTIARWLTPEGASISNGGLTPDFEVDRTIEDLEAGIDPQLDAAVLFLTTGEVPEDLLVEQDPQMEALMDGSEEEVEE